MTQWRMCGCQESSGERRYCGSCYGWVTERVPASLQPGYQAPVEPDPAPPVVEEVHPVRRVRMNDWGRETHA